MPPVEMPTICAAVDLGATSGRVVVGRWGDAGLELDEVHRFPNTIQELCGHAYWDLPRLWNEVRDGLKNARRRYPGLRSVGVDTWGVDHVLMNRQGRPLFPVHAYRDLRTTPLVEALRGDGLEWIYDQTGLPDYPYNSSLQLQESLQAMPSLRDSVDACLFLPDYFNFLLSGTICHEVSIASHSQFLSTRTMDWSREALDYFGIPASWFTPPVRSPRRLGPCRLWREGAPVEVIAVSGHDTASAFLALPANPEGGDVYLSTGTWSLVGFESESPLRGAEALAAKISNERMGDGGFRPVKACLGLWLLERLFDDFAERPGTPQEWDTLIAAAREASAPAALLDVSDARFFNPPSMRSVVDAALREAGAEIPTRLDGYVRLVCASLAEGHRAAIAQLGTWSGHTFQRALLTGGGARNTLLCQLTAEACGIPVVALDIEGAAVGNIASQLIGLGVVPNVPEFRRCFGAQLESKTYFP